jgi:hypothetical protein
MSAKGLTLFFDGDNIKPVLFFVEDGPHRNTTILKS